MPRSPISAWRERWRRWTPRVYSSEAHRKFMALYLVLATITAARMIFETMSVRLLVLQLLLMSLVLRQAWISFQSARSAPSQIALAGSPIPDRNDIS